MGVRIKRLTELPRAALAPLLAESVQAGWRFVARLADEWATGVNRFDLPGEVLFGGWAGRHLVGVCGLNVDPYAADPLDGRVRRLYVLAQFRRRGIGRRLVQAVLAAAAGRFVRLRLRTESPAAALFFERLGFHRQAGEPEGTFTLELAIDRYVGSRDAKFVAPHAGAES
jgi:GNAT superfamily N-acetyltransferase